MKPIVLTAVVFAALTASACAAVTGEEIVYRAGGTEMHGYLAYDDARKEPAPGILVVHEWWGHNEYARRRARMLAQLGYTALAVDMYGGGKNTEHPATAKEFATEACSREGAARERFEAALETLRAHPSVNPAEIGAIGYCFGGAVVLQMARAGLDLEGVVSFHGSLASSGPARSGDIEAKILVLHGGDDSFVSEEEMAAFRAEMEEAGADYEIVTYPGAKHSFTNPAADRFAEEYGMDVGYDREADEASWQAMKEFFGEIF